MCKETKFHLYCSMWINLKGHHNYIQLTTYKILSNSICTFRRLYSIWIALLVSITLIFTTMRCFFLIWVNRWRKRWISKKNFPTKRCCKKNLVIKVREVIIWPYWRILKNGRKLVLSIKELEYQLNVKPTLLLALTLLKHFTRDGPSGVPIIGHTFKKSSSVS